MRRQFLRSNAVALPGLIIILLSALAVPAHAQRPADVGAARPNNQRPPVDPTGGDDEIECLPYISGALTASPSEIVNGETVAKVRSGDPVTLSWTVSIPAGCVGIKLEVNEEAAGQTGTRVFHPLTPGVSRLTANKGGQQAVLGEVRLDVTLPRVVYIKGSTREWRNLLVYAVGNLNPNEKPIIRLMPEVDMDLTNRPTIRVKEGVTITGDLVPGEDVWAEAAAPPARKGAKAALRAAARIPRNPVATTSFSSEPIPGRSGLRLGPRLYTTGETSSAGQFRVECYEDGTGANDVTFSGFRLIGPNYGETASTSATGISIESCKRVEIANMELAGWSTQAIRAGDRHDQIKNPEPPYYTIASNALKVHDSFIHHNQNGQLGYGANVAGLYGRIERNVFDFNRHAIAGGASPGNGYVASQNLILKGGGVHIGLVTWQTHQIDVHGTDDCGVSEHNCGTAGTYFDIIGNAVQYFSGTAVEIRGKPEKRIKIAENVFPHDDEDDAIELQTHDNIAVGPNIYRFDSYGSYGVCDFDGDGRDDLFLATRRSWWFSSAAKVHWSYLREAPEELSVLGFGYFDGDNRCDAVKKSGAGLAISSGGKGPWKALPGAYDGPFDQMRFFDYDKDGVTDIFRRASDGGWQVAAANGQNSRRLNSSGFPITALLFANLAPDPGNSRDHRKDAVVDILRAVNGQIHVSRDGVDTWKPLNLSYGSCDRLFIADINADGQDDIVRFAPSAACNQPYGKWEASWSGATQWTALKTFDPPPGGAPVNAALLLRPFAGHFDENPGADLLMIDPSRNGSLYSDASKNFNKYSIYPY